MDESVLPVIVLPFRVASDLVGAQHSFSMNLDDVVGNAV
jgi:hypothetical protein